MNDYVNNFAELAAVVAGKQGPLEGHDLYIFIDWMANVPAEVLRHFVASDAPMPSDLCMMLGMPVDSSYSEGVRNVWLELCSAGLRIAEVNAQGDSSSPNFSDTKEESVAAGIPSREESRTAEDVYNEYVERYGLEACECALSEFWDATAIVEILLYRISADDMEEYLHDCFGEDDLFQPAEQLTDQETDDFLRALLEDEPTSDRVNWQQEGFLRTGAAGWVCRTEGVKIAA